MTDEIRQVRMELIWWLSFRPDDIRFRGDIVARNLRLLAADPDNLPLRIQTMKNVEELARANGGAP